MIGVVAHQGGQIEGDGEAGLALAQQIKIAPVGFFRRGEAGELPHGPELAAIHAFMDAARVGKLARRRELEGRGVSGGVDRFHRDAAEGFAAGGVDFAG